jgi:hypothetical protein
MILIKLQEALAAIPAQRKALDEVEVQLRLMISKLQGMPDLAFSATPSNSVTRGRIGRGNDRDKLDDIADVIRAEGKPLHVSIIAERLSAQSGKKIVRTTIEPGINRHIAKTKNPRIAKFAPSTYGLPEWKQPSLARTA